MFLFCPRSGASGPFCTRFRPGTAKPQSALLELLGLLECRPMAQVVMDVERNS